MTAPKRIGLEPRDEPGRGLVIAVTFPFPFTGVPTTRDVAISDESALRLIARVEELLRARGVRALPSPRTPPGSET